MLHARASRLTVEVVPLASLREEPVGNVVPASQDAVVVAQREQVVLLERQVAVGADELRQIEVLSREVDEGLDLVHATARILREALEVHDQDRRQAPELELL